MAGKSFKVVFELDESDAVHFRKLFSQAKKNAAKLDSDEVIAEATALVKRVKKTKKVPPFVLHAIQPLEDLIEMLGDKDYSIPKNVQKEVIAALAYFAEPQDLIPDHVPVLGFLDDAIMARMLEDEFEDELWAYRKFRAYREQAEHRPWTSVARERLPERLKKEREKLREKVIERRQKRSQKKGGSLFGLRGW